MRTFEELEAQNYKNITYGELIEYDLSCDLCPLYGEYCVGGMACYGDMPVEPPCCYFNNDDVLQDIYNKRVNSEHQLMLYEEEKERRQKLKEEKSKQRKQKLREYRIRNSKELEQIRLIKLKIKQQEKQIRALEDIKCYTSAINSVNKMFREAHQPNNQADINEKPINDEIKICKQNINEYKLQITKIKNNIKLNEKLRKKVGEDQSE